MAKQIRRALAASLAALFVAAAMTGCSRKPAPDAAQSVSAEDRGLKIGYAEGVTVVESPSALQDAVDEMLAANSETMGLEYKNEAVSDDGLNFDCYIANAERNQYDMFVAIYGDKELTDELFISGLLRPGTAFDRISLEHTLTRGSHTVYVAFTQVEELEDGEQAIHAQVMVTMNFTVTR